MHTFAYRNPFLDLRVFEVDHPSTQEWKRERLAAASIPIPPNVTFAPVDFESQSLAQELTAVGLQRDQPTFFSWLGVTYYLSLESFRDTLAFLAAQPAGSGLALDYFYPREELTEAADQRMLEATAALAASMGEPLRLYLTSAQLKAELTRVGFTEVEDLTRPDLQARYFAHRTDGLALRTGMAQLASAWIRR